MPRVGKDVKEAVEDVKKRASGDHGVLERDSMRWQTRMNAAGFGGRDVDRATPMQAFGAMRDSPCCGGEVH
ncbi:hypothetical protein FJZ53_04970 [Candidatus Woesearchaeota archaeon]|nr:hypothetical protein [Candidatus Woesearchaeota archaeon]